MHLSKKMNINRLITDKQMNGRIGAEPAVMQRCARPSNEEGAEDEKLWVETKRLRWHMQAA